MSSNVYVVSVIDDRSSWVDGVYSTLEKAQASVPVDGRRKWKLWDTDNANERRSWETSGWDIEEFPLD